MKIRIISNTFAHSYGRIFEAETYGNGYYLNIGTQRFFINKDDVEVVEEVEKNCKTCKFGELYKENKSCDAEFTDDYIPTCNKWQPIEYEGVGIKTETLHERIERESQSIWTYDVPKQATGTTEDAKHYMTGKQQPIETMQQQMTTEQFIGFLLGNVIKYSLRMNHKDQMRSDAGKCEQYAKWLVMAMDGVTIVPGGKA